MRRNGVRSMIVVLLIIGLAPLSFSTLARGAEPVRPNVVFIAVDDLNDWVGCLGGHPQALTPNIDRLARRGVLFTNAHCAAPSCNPSRAAVLSGRMPWVTNVWSNSSRTLLRQHPDMPVLPRAFQAAGYRTFGAGKILHPDGEANRGLFERHFEAEQRWSPFTAAAVAYTAAELPSKKTADPRHVVKLEGVPSVVLPLNRMPSDRNPDRPIGESFDWGPLDVPDSRMGDTLVADWAIEQLKAKHEQPFFLAVGFYRPHIPLWAPKSYFERFQGKEVELPQTLATDLDDLGPTGKQWALQAETAGLHATVVKHGQWRDAVRAYLACTTFVDGQVGRVIDALDRGDFSANTVVVFWGDHGWHLGEKEHWGKWTGWERSTRVPLIIVPPKNAAIGGAAIGKTCEQPVSLVDLYPTLVELCGIAAPGPLDGTSLVPLLRDPAKRTDRTVATVFDPGNVALRSERGRYIRYRDGSEELYDLKEDPREWTNLAGKPGMNGILEEFRRQVPAAALPK